MKIPEHAFHDYVRLGVERSYRRLAEMYGCTKRAVTKKAAKENWAARLLAIREQADDVLSENHAEALADMDARHLQALEALQLRALEYLSKTPIDSTSQAIRALVESVKIERLIRGKANERREHRFEHSSEPRIRLTGKLIAKHDDDDAPHP